MDASDSILEYPMAAEEQKSRFLTILLTNVITLAVIVYVAMNPNSALRYFIYGYGAFLTVTVGLWLFVLSKINKREILGSDLATRDNYFALTDYGKLGRLIAITFGIVEVGFFAYLGWNVLAIIWVVAFTVLYLTTEIVTETLTPYLRMNGYDL